MESPPILGFDESESSLDSDLTPELSTRTSLQVDVKEKEIYEKYKNNPTELKNKIVAMEENVKSLSTSEPYLSILKDLKEKYRTLQILKTKIEQENIKAEIKQQEKKLFDIINKPSLLLFVLKKVLNEIEPTKKINSIYSAKKKDTFNFKNIGPSFFNPFVIDDVNLDNYNKKIKKNKLYEQWKGKDPEGSEKEIKEKIKELKQHIQFIKKTQSDELKQFELEIKKKYKDEINYIELMIEYLDYVKKKLKSEINESESEYLNFVNSRRRDPENSRILDKFNVTGGSKKKNKRSKTKRSKTKRSKTKRSKTKRL